MFTPTPVPIFIRVWVLRLLLPVGFLSLGACANTPFGQQLTNNFDSQESTNQLKESFKESNTSKISASTKVFSKPAAKKSSAASIRLRNKKNNPRKLMNPQPYRITIKLSKADPAAPAEAVTKALRMAGVSFEVEMIQRVNSSSTNKSVSPLRRLGP